MSAIPTTATEMKEKEHATWTRMAPGWKKHDAYLSRLLQPVNERMLSGGLIGPGQRILDIATGTGEPALTAAAQVSPTGRVLATDFVEEMLACAREKAAARDLANVDFRRVDGEELDVPPGSFDAVLIRFGLMFMTDPDACLRRAYQSLRAGGHLAAACWAAPAANPWVRVPLASLRRRIELPTPPPFAPGIFKFADPQVLRGALERAGFTQIALSEVPVTFGGWQSAPDFVAFIREIAGPIAVLFGRLDVAAAREVAAEIATEIASGWSVGDGDRVVVPGLAWVALGTR